MDNFANGGVDSNINSSASYHRLGDLPDPNSTVRKVLNKHHGAYAKAARAHERGLLNPHQESADSGRHYTLDTAYSNECSIHDTYYKVGRA
jgi:hypothetical protein